MIVPQLHDELLAAAGRPVLARRLPARVIAATVAAIVTLLIAAPPSVAGLPAAGAVFGHVTR